MMDRPAVVAPPARHRLRLPGAYWSLWGASSVSNLADGVRVGALPLIAVFLTEDPRLVAGLTVMRTLPWLLFGLIAGAVVDRVDRRRLMIAVSLVQGVLLLVLAGALVVDRATIMVLYVIAFALGVGETLYDNAAQTILPAVVRPELLPEANGKLVATERVANEFIGPPLGTAIYAFGVALPIFIDAGLSTAAGVLLLLLLPGSFRATPDADGRSSIYGQIAESLRWVWRHRAIRTLAALAAVVGIVDTAWYATLVLFALNLLGVPQAGFGLLLAAGAIGSVVGAFVAPWVSRRFGPAAGIIGTLVAAGLVQAALGLTSHAIVGALLLAASGLALTVWNVLVVSVRQAIVPPQILGRVNAAYRFVGLGSMPAGALLGGLVGNAFGLRAPLLLGAPILVVAALLAVRTVNRHTVVLPQG